MKTEHLYRATMLAVHILALGIFFVPFHWSYVWVCIGMYYLRMFGITAGFHRYFSHRTFQTSRIFQFVLALLGTLSWQSGVLWWTAHHRHHHRYSDEPNDIHSPVQMGFWRSHIGWIFEDRNQPIRWDLIKDFSKYPELVFLQKFDGWPGVIVAVGFYFFGGAGLLFWGWILSTVLLWHGTFLINSMAHVWGSRRFQTQDTSKNNLWLSLLTLGEGWHNNHHFYQSSVRQGFYWWEFDLSYYILFLFSKFGMVWGMKHVPTRLLENEMFRITSIKVPSGYSSF